MDRTLSAVDLSNFERTLHARAAELRKKIRETRARSANEQYTQVAGEVPDPEDAALAGLVSNANSAELERDSEALRDVDQALRRIATASYGICLRCGEPIEPARLEALPTAKRDQGCQALHDREHGATHRRTL